MPLQFCMRLAYNFHQRQDMHVSTHTCVLCDYHQAACVAMCLCKACSVTAEPHVC